VKRFGCGRTAGRGRFNTDGTEEEQMEHGEEKERVRRPLRKAAATKAWGTWRRMKS
jgi:hypothetical protein